MQSPNELIWLWMGRKRRFARCANTPPFAVKPQRMGHPVYGHGLLVAEGFHGFYAGGAEGGDPAGDQGYGEE